MSKATKIYINNYNPSAIKDKINLLSENIKLEKNIIEIISPDGIFNVENNNIYKLKPIDFEIKTDKLNNFTLLFDESYYVKEEVLSQIPYDHIISNKSIIHYTTTGTKTKTFVELVVEGIYESNFFTATSRNNSIDKLSCFRPINFYFLINEPFDNILVKKELSVFLSMLN